MEMHRVLVNGEGNTGADIHFVKKDGLFSAHRQMEVRPSVYIILLCKSSTRPSNSNFN